MNQVLSKIKKHSKIAIFSTSIISKYLLEIINKEREDIEVLYFIDSFQKGTFQNIEILSPQEAALKNEISLYIIASFSNADLLENILKSHGINNIIKLSQEAFQEINNIIAADAGKSFSKDMIQERYPSGHYYSAVPSATDLSEFLKSKNDDVTEFAGIDLNLQKQLDNLKYFDKIYDEFDFPFNKKENKLYYLDNIWFHPYDTYVLASMMRKYKPSRIIEIGSGFSTGLMLDINQQFFDDKIEITCIEPNPQRLKDVTKNRLDNLKFYEKRLQEIDVSVFKALKDNDILFVDSSHVAKMNSDVLKIFFEVLPMLNKNVIIHFHDIFNNFSYPKEWVNQRRCWNETFMLRAFLQYNSDFSVEFYSDFLRAFADKNNIETKLPMNQGSGSIYLRKEV